VTDRLLSGIESDDSPSDSASVSIPPSNQGRPVTVALPRTRRATGVTATAKKWLSRLVKFGFCAAAIWYLSTKVSLNDHARLAATPDKAYTLVRQTGDTLTLLDPDTHQERTAGVSELADRTKLKKGQQPIELGLRSLARGAQGNWLGLAILLMGPTTFFMAWRLKLLLAVQEIAIGLRESVLLTFAGNFFNFAMPGTTGGDLYKAFHIAKRTHKRTEGVTVVFLDRVIGLISFLILASLAMLLAYRQHMLGDYGRSVGYLMIAMFVCGALYFSRRVRAFVRYEALLLRLPLADKFQRVDETAFSFRYHPKQAIASLLVTLVSHIFMVSSIFFLARSLGIGPHGPHDYGDLYLAIMLAVFVGYLFAAIPISIQGFGLLEAVFVRVLVEGGWSSMNQMLALTLGARLVQILWALPGVLVPWLGMPRPPEGAIQPGDQANGAQKEAGPRMSTSDPAVRPASLG